MSKPKKYTPKHAAPKASRTAAARTAARTTMVASVAVTATGAAVGTGIVVSPVSTVATLAAGDPASETGVSIPAAAGRETREEGVSRTADRRGAADPAKQAALSQEPGNAVTRSEDLSDEDPRDIARALLPTYGWADQFSCLDSLWVSESDWRVDADNPTSSAYGIPQALTQLHDLPAGYMTDAEVQIRWGLDYIQDSYGSPCSAWSFKQGNNWY
ncbi:lytic transglycosylase domain-containing protein [Nocardioides sp.]|uniref:aggregation-promoting factor C-terminal-like domain-containing protein n=1 Tax=Nocardioides sp. TaxID=35761 RepID=UPI002623C5AD|nr:lytic transglycosylase domain-containing protein [Nocardioides sp.]